MEQYYREKKQYPDALLLFRVGDFYETFAEDAVIEYADDFDGWNDDLDDLELSEGTYVRLTADAQNLCLNGLCFAYELLEPLEENPQADCPQLFVLDAGSMGVLRGEYYFEEHQLHLSVDGQEKIFSPVIAPPAAQVILPQAPTTVPSAKNGASVQRTHG